MAPSPLRGGTGGAGRGWAGACHVVVSGSQVVDQGAGASSTSAASGRCPMYNCHCKPSFLCCRHCHGQGSPSPVSASPARWGLSGAAVSSLQARMQRSSNSTGTSGCCLSLCYSQTTFLFFFHVMLGQEGTPKSCKTITCVLRTSQHETGILAPTL